jgi:hypothetical protein
MASTYSDLKIELIGTGEQVGTWGATTNTNLGTAIEDAITGSANVSFSSADVTLTLTNTNGSQTARNLRLVCTGTSGGARNLILGSGCQINKLYLVQNDLADAVTVKNTAGTGVAVPAGKSKFVFNDGTNVVLAESAPIINLATDVTGTLPIANGGTGATTNTQARTNLGLGTIATQAANNVAITGGSITGITDLAVADGGTGASNAAGARTNLGLVIGTDVPGPTGTGASGTWNISVLGNAATATNATNAATVTDPFPTRVKALLATASPTSGTVVDFTGLADWDAIDVVFQNLNAGTSEYYIQVSTNNGASYLNSGYQSRVSDTTSSSASTTYLITSRGASGAVAGITSLANMSVQTTMSSDVLIAGAGGRQGTAAGIAPAGSVNAIRISTSTGGTFTSGTVYIFGRIKK